MTRISDYIDQLNAELDREPFNIQRFDALLADLYALGSPTIIGPLLGVFRDVFPYEEAFWSVIHTVEGFASNDYLDELIGSISARRAISQTWLALLLSRIANSQQYRNAFLESAARIPSEVDRAAVYDAVLAATKDTDTANMRAMLERLGSIRAP